MLPIERRQARLFKIALNVNPSEEQFWISYIDALVKDNQVKNAKTQLKGQKSRV